MANPLPPSSTTRHPLHSGLSEDGETIVLRKFHGLFDLCANARERLPASKLGLVLDVETTGLDRAQDTVIEIGIVAFRFDPADGSLLEINASISALQDPGVPLSEEIKKVTGLTDQDLQGKAIDWEPIQDLIQSADVIIAHNAEFDRPFIERSVPTAAEKLWCCSLKQLNWFEKGFASQKLEILSLYHGFFTDAHRALNDSQALLHLLSKKDATTGKPYLHELTTNATRPFVLIKALHARFETKDVLKKMGYRWDNLQRVWSKAVYKDVLEAEIKALEAEVYFGRFAGSAEEIPVTENFRTKPQ